MNNPENDENLKSQELYKLARDAYTTAEKRFDDAEGKIHRYLSILFVVMGLATIGVDKFRSIVFVAAIPNIVFGIFTAMFYTFGLVAFCYFVRALRVQIVRSLKLDKSVVVYFGKYTLSESLKGLAPAFFTAAGAFQHGTQQKLNWAFRGFRCLLLAVAFAVAMTASYFFIHTPMEKMMTISNDSRGDGNGTESQPVPTPEPVSDPSQAEEDASQLFEDLQKSFEGGETK